MTQLTKRQQEIINLIASREKVQNHEIVAFFESQNEPISRETIGRELGELVVSGHLSKIGEGRGVAYKLKQFHSLLKQFDYESYFLKEQDQRTPGIVSFDPNIISKLSGLFTPFEIIELREKNDLFKRRVSSLPETILHTLTTFNIAGRYDDEKREFRKNATKDYSEKYLMITDHLILWLKENYLKKS